MPGRRSATAITRLFRWWQRLAPLPGGRWFFSRLIGFIVPYSGSIWPRIVLLKPGHVICEIYDRGAIRNHLNSIHAIALANLGELTSGLAQMSTLTPGQRGIVTKISIEYFKKARGTLRAESTARVPEIDNDDVDIDVTCDIRDTGGDVVARTVVRWRIGEQP